MLGCFFSLFSQDCGLKERIHLLLLLLILGLVPTRRVVLLGHEVLHRRFLGLGLERIRSLLLKRIANWKTLGGKESVIITRYE